MILESHNKTRLPTLANIFLQINMLSVEYDELKPQFFCVFFKNCEQKTHLVSVFFFFFFFFFFYLKANLLHKIDVPIGHFMLPLLGEYGHRKSKVYIHSFYPVYKHRMVRTTKILSCLTKVVNHS